MNSMHSNRQEDETNDVTIDQNMAHSASRSFFQMRAGLSNFMKERRKNQPSQDHAPKSFDDSNSKKVRTLISMRQRQETQQRPKVRILKPILSLLPPKPLKPTEIKTLPPTPLPVRETPKQVEFPPSLPANPPTAKPIPRVASPIKSQRPSRSVSPDSRRSKKSLVSPGHTLNSIPGMQPMPHIIPEAEDPDDPFQKVTQMLLHMGFIKPGGSQDQPPQKAEPKPPQRLTDTLRELSVDIPPLQEPSSNKPAPSTNKVQQVPTPIKPLVKPLPVVAQPPPATKPRLISRTDASSVEQPSAIRQDPRFAFLPPQVLDILHPPRRP